MLSTMRHSWLLFALFALLAFTHALNLENLHIDGIEEYLHHGKRQRPSGTGNESAPSQTPSPSSAAPSSSPPPPSSSDSKPSEPSSQQPSPSSTPSPKPTPSSTPNTAPTSAPTSSKPTATTPIIKTTPLVSTDVQEYVTIYTTVSDGRTFETSSTGTSTNLVTTGTATTTESPLPQNDNNNGGGGLSESNKKIIGGVVGGVGGAILLGGIAIVLWRVYGRKNRVSEDDDDLAAGTGSALGDKPHSSSTGNTPFQSNLEQYHNPGGRPNAAANF